MKQNIAKYIILPTLILSIFACVDLPKSHAKYFKDGTLTYDTKLKSLKTENTTIALDDNSNYSNAIYNLSFDRNGIMYEDSAEPDTKDTYKITLKNTKNNCSIVTGSIKKINSDGTEDTEGGIEKLNNKEAKVSYGENRVNTGGKIQFQVDCNVIDDETNKIEIDYSVDETIAHRENGEEKEDPTFTYITSSKAEESNLTNVDSFLEIYGKNLYTNAIDAIKQYANRYTADSETVSTLIKYFNTAFGNYLTDNDLAITNKKFKETDFSVVDGFSYNSETNTYEIDDNYIGYALTWYRIKTNNSKYQFAFSITDNDKIKTIFRYYLDKYATSFSEEDKTKIINYIESKGDYNNLLNYGIYEFRAQTLSFNSNVKIVHINTAIISIIENNSQPTSDGSYQVLSGTTAKKVVFDNFIDSLNENTNLGTDVVAKINNKYEKASNPGIVGESVLRNVGKTSEESTSFSDFHIIKNDYEGISKMINIYSDPTNPTNTYFKTFNLVKGEEITLMFPTNKTQTTISKDFQNIGYTDEITTLIDQIYQATDNTEIGSFSGFTGTPVTPTDANGIDHIIYEINGVTYDIYTVNNIKYIKFTLN